MANIRLVDRTSVRTLKTAADTAAKQSRNLSLALDQLVRAAEAAENIAGVSPPISYVKAAAGRENEQYRRLTQLSDMITNFTEHAYESDEKAAAAVRLITFFPDAAYAAKQLVPNTKNQPFRQLLSWTVSILKEISQITHGSNDHTVHWKNKSQSSQWHYLHDDTYNSEKTGYYGANQGAPYTDVAVYQDIDRRNEYLSIIKQNKGKSMSDKELEEYLWKMNKEGCGYASITNTVFEYYSSLENGEELFKEHFGFDMKDQDGNANLNHLLVYIYSKYDNPFKKGLTARDQISITKKVMEEPGKNGTSKVKIKEKYHNSLTKQEIEKNLREGKQIVISSRNVMLYEPDGTPAQNCAGAGHALSVTGVLSDGRIVVSSWGKIYLVDPRDQGKLMERWGRDDNNQLVHYKGKMKLEYVVIDY